MKVFISFSGKQSEAIARKLSEYLQCVINSIEPFFSQDDIEKGSFWMSDIRDQLSEATAGLLIVTPESKSKPWMLFEAGALSSKFGKPCVIPLLFSVEPGELEGPLKELQAARFDRDEFLKCLNTINRKLEISLPDNVLQKSLDAFWPQIEAAIRTETESWKVKSPIALSKEEMRLIELKEMMNLALREIRELKLGSDGADSIDIEMLNRLCLQFAVNLTWQIEGASLISRLPFDISPATDELFRRAIRGIRSNVVPTFDPNSLNTVVQDLCMIADFYINSERYMKKRLTSELYKPKTSSTEN